MVGEIGSVSAVVRRWADRAPGRVCLVFHGRDDVIRRLTYADLARRAAAHARLYRARGLRPGNVLMLVAHSTPGFVTAFLGAQEAGLLAVPCPPPEPLESARRVRERMREIVARCRAGAFLDPESDASDVGLPEALAGSGVVVLTKPDATEAAPPASIGGSGPRSSLAYCQFTSGSGGRAKGVLLSHESVAANIRAMAEAYELSPADVFVTWMPLFHDWGLVGYVLMPLVLGHEAHVMTSLAFMARPIAWLELISRVGGTVSAAPNFAYALCARKISDEQTAALDLSTWRVACVGAEPVTRAATEAFVRRFARCGFRPSVLVPGYGLAEDTLCATSRHAGEGPRFEEISRQSLEREGIARLEPGGVVVASVGRPLTGHEIAILGDDGQPLGERRIGEIVIRSGSLMQAYLPGTEGEVSLAPDGRLYTGDLGYLADGELFVVGRRKDLIIRAGRNHYPQDIEDAVTDMPGLRSGRVVAFAAPGLERERIVVAAERASERGDEAGVLKLAVSDAVRATTGVIPDEVLLLPRHTLPLTSSGKVMRSEARRLYLAGAWSE